jgi:hypothetical protein
MGDMADMYNYSYGDDIADMYDCTYGDDDIPSFGSDDPYSCLYRKNPFKPITTKQKAKRMKTKITLNNVRLSFPSLWEKNVFQGQEGKYVATFLFPKNGKTWEKLYKNLRAIEDYLISENKLNRIPKGDSNRAVKDGDEKDYQGYEGCWTIRASNEFRPGLYDRQALQVDKEDSPFYAGCYVNAEVELWAQNNKFGQRVNASLLNVQFVRDGEPFTAGRPGRPEFAPIENEEEWEEDETEAVDVGM